MALRLLFPYDADRFGGHVVSSFHLIEGLRARGHDAQVAIHGEGPVRDMALAQGLPVIDAPQLGAVSETQRSDGLRWGNIAAAPSAVSLLREGGFDVVHTNDKRMLRTWCAPAALSGARVIAHWRATYLPSTSVGLALRVAERVLCVSRYSFETLPAFARKKAEIILNPFPDRMDEAQAAAARRDVRDELAIPGEVALIGVFGSFLQRKRPHVLLDVLRRLDATADGRPIWGLACGERATPYDTLFDERLAAHPELAARLVRPGRVSPPMRYMAACDVIIAPSVAEPFARVGIEAQASGVPVLVSSDGGLRETVEHGVSGFILAPDAIEDWCATIRRVLDDGALARRLSAAGRHAAADLTLDRHVDAVMRAYERGSSHRVPLAEIEIVPADLDGSDGRDPLHDTRRPLPLHVSRSASDA